jgi:CTP synthase
LNNEYLKDIEANGMVASGINPDTKLVEILEIPDHPFFLGTQYHPELKSTVEKPHPLFVAFVKACLGRHLGTHGDSEKTIKTAKNLVTK